jgi:CHRD domain-containing protein
MRKAVLFTAAIGLCLATQSTSIIAQNNDIVVVKAYLDGGQEEPNKILTGAHGVATITLNRATRQIQYVLDVYDFPFRATAAHIHVGPPGTGAGPVIINFVVPASSISAFRIAGTATVADLVVRPAQGINSLDDAFMAIAAGVTYANVHSEANPGGEIRGRLCPASAAANTFSGINTCQG